MKQLQFSVIYSWLKLAIFVISTHYDRVLNTLAMANTIDIHSYTQIRHQISVELFLFEVGNIYDDSNGNLGPLLLYMVTNIYLTLSY